MTAMYLREGDVAETIKILRSDEELPQSSQDFLAGMLTPGTQEETGTEFRLVLRRRDGKRGPPKKTLKKRFRDVDLGARVVELLSDGYDYAVATAASEFGVSIGTAKNAYSSSKKALELQKADPFYGPKLRRGNDYGCQGLNKSDLFRSQYQ